MILAIIIAMIASIGCVAPKTTHFIQPGYNLNGFRYVYISPPIYQDGTIDKHDLAQRLSKLFAQEGVQVLSKYDLESLPENELGQVLYCNISHFHTPDGYGLGGTYITVTIDLYDMFQQRIFRGKGIYQGSTMDDDFDGGIKMAFQAFSEKYTGFDPSFAIDEKIKKEYAHWETIDINKEQLQDYFDRNIKNLAPIEGIWTSFEGKPHYQIGIIKDPKSTERDFVAIIISSGTPSWQPKQVKIEFQKTAYKSLYTTTYYTHNHSKQMTTASIDKNGILKIQLKQLFDDSSFEINFIKNYPMNVTVSSTGRIGSSEINQSQGSGFLLAETGIVVTNYHIVKDSSNIEVLFPQVGITVKAKLALKDVANDLVILRLTDFNFSNIFSTNIPYSIALSNSVKLGQEVFTLGFPLGAILGKSARVSTGTINSLYGIQDDPRLFQISNPIQPGNSGSPLFNQNGEIVGIVVATLNAKYFYENTDVIPQNVNFAIKSDYINNLSSMLPENEEIKNRHSQLTSKNLEEQLKLITPFVVTVKSQ